MNRRLVLYLLLNVFVSACVTGGILFWYDRNYRLANLSAVQPAIPSGGQGNAPGASFDPNIDIPVEIVSIVGAGTLDAEWVLVRNAGTSRSISQAGSCRTATERFSSSRT
jgi:hypothetical protein